MSFFGRSAATPSTPSSGGPSSPSAAQVAAASMDSPAGRRQYKDLFSHQYAAVSHQTDEGLRTLKRSTAFFEHICESQVTLAEATTKNMKSVKEKYADVKDDCTHYVNASLMIEEVFEHTNKTAIQFNTSVLNELVKPMRNWYKVTNNKKLLIDKEMNKLNDKLKSSVEDINKERRGCLTSFNELKQSLAAMKALEQTGGEPYNKAKKTWQKNKEITYKKFQAFDSRLENARVAQNSFYMKDIPNKLSELEAIERERLAYQQECYLKFQGFYNSYSSEMQKSNDLMAKVLPTLNINKAMNVLFDKWTAAFGPPPVLVPIPYELPCLAADIQSDVLDANGPPMNGSPAVGSSSSFGGLQSPSSHAASASHAAYANYNAAPPPPPANDYNDYNHNAANPFAAAAASASVPAAPASDVLFSAEALFDFDLPGDVGADIQYVHFKAGERIKVLQEGDEWWFGEVRGTQGFFPYNYVKKL